MISIRCYLSLRRLVSDNHSVISSHVKKDNFKNARAIFPILVQNEDDVNCLNSNYWPNIVMHKSVIFSYLYIFI